MQKMKLVFKEDYPLAGAMRKKGETLLHCLCPIDGATPEKIINAIKNNAVTLEIVKEEAKEEKPQTENANEKKEAKDEKKNNHNGLGSMFSKRSGRNR